MQNLSAVCSLVWQLASMIAHKILRNNKSKILHVRKHHSYGRAIYTCTHGGLEKRHYRARVISTNLAMVTGQYNWYRAPSQPRARVTVHKERDHLCKPKIARSLKTMHSTTAAVSLTQAICSVAENEQWPQVAKQDPFCSYYPHQNIESDPRVFSLVKGNINNN